MKKVQFINSEIDFSGGAVVMGILNVTPDSFSDGGEFFDVARAIARGQEIEREGGVIIDIGAESTRPGAEPVCDEVQIARVVPVIEGLKGKVGVAISIDTYSYEVALEAIDAGAEIINDVTGMSDERIGELAAERGAGLVLMHMKGDPKTMQVNPEYEDVVEEVRDFLVGRAKRAEEMGVSKERIFVDPGIGFGKSFEHNLLLLKNIGVLVETGYKVLVGTSRKGFIGKITGREKAGERVFGTAATAAICAASGAAVVRVHDVEAMVEAVKVANAISRI